MKKSPKKIEIEKKISNKLSGKLALAAFIIFNDQEAQILQNYAYAVSIKRLRSNNHDPVHIRKLPKRFNYARSFV